jgi:uncharacterized membrane protein YqjE
MSDQTMRGAPPPATDPTQPKEPERSLPELLSRLTDDVNRLFSTQLELAKVEIKEEVTKAAKGAGLLSGGAVAAVVALLVLSHAAAWGLSEVVPEGVAFLIVGVAWALVAAVLAMQGRSRLKDTDPVPRVSVAELEADRDLVREELSRS